MVELARWRVGQESMSLDGELIAAQVVSQPIPLDSAIHYMVYAKRKRTPLTILDPIRVTCPFTLSLRGLDITRVFPGSMGASKA